jgi:4-hydroxy-tetrahydrodipicolinate reductase
MSIKVAVTGAAGAMGRTVIRAIQAADDLELAGALDLTAVGEDSGEVAGGGESGVAISPAEELATVLRGSGAQVLVDFTAPSAVMGNLRTALGLGVRCVVGTTGFTDETRAEVGRLCEENQTAAIIAPNFSLGANLMMRFAAEAAKHLDYAEIIELHHERKQDAPSGTAIKTAEMMAAARGREFAQVETKLEKAPGARGAMWAGIPVHSVRLQGLVAHQEVMFGGLGEVLQIRHDSISRESFMPGVLLAVRKVVEMEGLTLGLELLL